MDFDLFEQIYHENIKTIIEEIKSNNSQIQYNKNHTNYIKAVYNEYCKLNSKYKDNIFEKKDDALLLDRHKIASCICGAFLKCPVFDKTNMVRILKEEKKLVESYFYYVNELVAFHAGSRFLAFFLVTQDDIAKDIAYKAYKEFPTIPEVSKSKKGFWNSILFNLAEVSDKQQIGLDHYDIYAYAMIFYWLEYFFNNEMKK